MAIIRNEIVPALSDFGFKNLFGKGEKTKENLIFLLNEILKEYPGMGKIVEVEYKNAEQNGENPGRKTTQFDIYCRTEDNRVFIVEMQNETESYLKKRLIFYMCQAVTENDSRTDARKAWNYDFPPVIVIMLCNFTDREMDAEEVNYFGLLNLKTHRKFGDHIGLAVLQLPLFPKERKECRTELEKIIYTLTHMDRIVSNKEESFSRSKGDFYDRIERMSQTATFTNEELHAYHQWLKVTNDERLRLEKGREEGREEGRAEGRKEGRSEERYEIARTALKMNMPLKDIVTLTGLSPEEIQSLSEG